jgi:hypothetical protein
MPVFDSKNLLIALSSDVQKLLDTLDKLRKREDIDWNKQPEPGRWSGAQIIEHLNSYYRFYLPVISVALEHGKSKHIAYKSLYKSGFLGNYFTKMMKPDKNGKIGNKMNAPKDHTPSQQLNIENVIHEFTTEQAKLLGYLNDAMSTDIGELKVPISISKHIKLKLGDTLRFLIAHQQRHFIQLQNTLNKID